MVFHQIVSPWCGLSSGDLQLVWSFIRLSLLGVVFHHVVYHWCGLSSGWSLTGVVFHQGGLPLIWSSSGWSLIGGVFKDWLPKLLFCADVLKVSVVVCCCCCCCFCDSAAAGHQLWVNLLFLVQCS